MDDLVFKNTCLKCGIKFTTYPPSPQGPYSFCNKCTLKVTYNSTSGTSLNFVSNQTK